MRLEWRPWNGSYVLHCYLMSATVYQSPRGWHFVVRAHQYTVEDVQAFKTPQEAQEAAEAAIDETLQMEARLWAEYRMGAR